MRDHLGEALGLRGGAGGEGQQEGYGPGGEDMPTGPIWNPHAYCRGHRTIWNPHTYCRGHRPIQIPTSIRGVPGPGLQDLMGPLPRDPGAARVMCGDWSQENTTPSDQDRQVDNRRAPGIRSRAEHGSSDQVRASGTRPGCYGRNTLFSQPCCFPGHWLRGDRGIVTSTHPWPPHSTVIQYLRKGSPSLC